MRGVVASPPLARAAQHAPRDNDAAPRSRSIVAQAAHAVRHGTAASPVTGASARCAVAAPGASWDFTRIPLHQPDGAKPSFPLQAKLMVGALEDPQEHEAERAADRVMRATEAEPLVRPSPAQPRCDACARDGDGPEEPRRTPATSALARGGEAPDIVHRALQLPGEKLDATTRGSMEQAFGRNFETARIHRDTAADRAARSIDALAFTVGHDIVFRHDAYAPGSSAGRRLLAHELAHVVQQGAGPPTVKRQTEQYETRGLELDPTLLNRQAELGYWDLKLRASGFVPGWVRGGQRPFVDAEEANAVLAMVWQIRPTSTIQQEVTQVITIPKRPGLGAKRVERPAVTYQVTFRPPRPPARDGTVDLRFIAEGTAAEPLALEPASTSYRRKAAYSAGGFPGNDVEAYWAAHGDEERAVFNWVEHTAGRRFDQVVVARSGSGTTARETLFQVQGTKDPSDDVSDLRIIYLGPPERQHQLPADYVSHDFVDKSLEDARTTPDPVRGDKLGKLIMPDNLAAEERISVKFAVSQYFTSRPMANEAGTLRPGSRNTEVHAVVPIVSPPLGMATPANSNRRVLYIFRFKPNNDVEIQRVGEEGERVGARGSRFSLTQGGLAQHSLAEISGYLDHATDVAAATAWLTTRYPAVTPGASATLADLEKNVATQILRGSVHKEWFEKNYGIIILDKNDAKKWMHDNITTDEHELKDMEDFTERDLLGLERALERMSDLVLPTFKNVRLLRQKVSIEWIKGTNPPEFEEKPNRAGLTHLGTQRTIRIFDAAVREPEVLFVGGGPESKPAQTATGLVFAHEFGHVVEHADKKMRKAFDDLVAAKHIKPITWYAASDPPQELFAESFALYYADPAWLKQNWPDLFGFFDALDKSGPARPPGAKKTGAAPKSSKP
jgi:hypothetical protein